MKQLTIILAAAFFSVQVKAQSKDTVIKKDSVYVPLYEKSDTTVGVILYLADDGNVKHTTGYVIRKGFMYQKKDKQLTWADEPKISGYYNSKNQLIKRAINFLNKN